MRHFPLLLLTALVLSGGAMAQSPADQAPALTGTAWTLASATRRPEATMNLGGTWTLTGGTALRAVPGQVPSLTLAGGRVSGTGGCNRLSGTFRLAGERLILGPLASTRMACAPEVNAQEAAFLAFLGAPLTASLQALTLTLTDPAGRTLVFRRTGMQGGAGLRAGGVAAARSQPRAAAADGSYTLAALDSQPALRTSRPVTLTLGGGRIGGSDGCNSFGGMYRLEDGHLVLAGPLRTTLLACPEPDGEVDLPGVLRARPALAVTPGGLTLTANGTTLEFRRASPAGRP